MFEKGPDVDHNNRHLLILDGHISHVTLEVVKISMNSGLDIISPSSHTSHALQLLNVASFKLFKNTFRKCRDLWSMENNNKKVGKQELSEWTSRALKAALIPKNIKEGFCLTEISPLDHTTPIQTMGIVASLRLNTNETAGIEQCDE